MNIEPINFSDFDLVEIKNGTPHCIKHGAMNKMTLFEDGGGYWRCITYVTKQNDTACRAGCCEKRDKVELNYNSLICGCCGTAKGENNGHHWDCPCYNENED